MDIKKTKNKNILNQNKRSLKKKNKINIIFDLDETLIQTLDINFENNKSYIVENPSLSNIAILNIPGNKRSTFLYIRPYYLNLIDYFYRNFNVSFWTAGTENYCRSIIDVLLSEEQKNETKIILSRNSFDKNIIVNIKDDKMYKINHYKEPKPLKFLWKNFNNFNKENTLIIDNSYSVTRYYPYNSILVESYCRLNEEDDVLLLLREKLFKINRLNKKNMNVFSKKKKSVLVNSYKHRKLRMPIIKSLSYNNIEKYLTTSL